MKALFRRRAESNLYPKDGRYKGGGGFSNFDSGLGIYFSGPDCINIFSGKVVVIWQRL